MILLTPASPDIVKNYFIHEGDRGKVIKVEEKSIESIDRRFLNYITQVMLGDYNMNKKFPPGQYYFIWVEFSSYIRHLFISSVNPNSIAPNNFFLYEEIEIRFDHPDAFVVW